MKKLFDLAFVSLLIIFSFSLGSPSASAATAPELPRIYVDTSIVAPTGKTIEVKAGDDLQKAIDSASYGDKIVLQSGATFTGGFKLRKKSGSGVITITSSDFHVPPGTRVDPAKDAASMAKIVSPGNGDPALQTETGASGYRIIGVEFGKASPSASVTNLIMLGWYETSLADLPSHIILDRIYAHGDPSSDLRRCVALNGAYMAVIDSYISDCHEVGADSQAVGGWNGPGPFKIVNNFLEGAAENVLFGGADPRIANLTPSDIEIRQNYIYKPLSWKKGDPSYAGEPWSVKNLLEMKNAKRVLIDGNIFENNWTMAQTGTAIVLKSANQNGKCPWCISSDITVSNNVIKNVEEGFRLNGAEGSPLPLKATRISFKNDLFENVSSNLFQIFNGVSDVTMDHVTGYSPRAILFGDGLANSDMTITNSVFQRGKYGIGAGDTVEGKTYLNTWFTPWSFTGNVLINTGTDVSNTKLAARYPDGTKVVSSKSDVASGIGADLSKINLAQESNIFVPIASDHGGTQSQTSSQTAASGGSGSQGGGGAPQSPDAGASQTSAPTPAPVSSGGGGGGGGGSSPSSSGSSIDELAAQLTMLMKQLASLKGYSAPAASASTSSGGQASAASYTQDLTLGSSGPEVVSLQQMLVGQGYLVMPAGVSYGYFGPLTQEALAKWQAANGVSPSAGYWGPISRSKVQ